MMELWPFTNFHDLNLDWIIKKIRNVEDSEAAAKASEEAAADSASSASAAMGMAMLYRNKAKDYRDEAQGFANDAEDSAESIAGVVNQVNANTGRIDNLIATAGDGTIPSELTDIRVGYMGYTYDTAGNAVRSEAKYSGDAVITPASTIGIERGAWGAGFPDNSDPTHRVRTVTALHMYAGDYIANLSNGIDMGIMYRPVSDPLTAYGTDTGWITSGNTFTCNSEMYVYIAFKKHDNATIEDNEVATIAAPFFIVNKYTTTEKLSYNRQLPVVNKADIDNIAAGFKTFDVDNFQCGALNAGNQVLVYYRCHMIDSVTYPYDVTIKADEGFRFGVQTFDSEDAYTSDSGWQTMYTVPANTRFRLVISQVPENTATRIYGMLPVFVDHIKYSTAQNAEVQALTGLLGVDGEYKLNGESFDTTVKKYDVSIMPFTSTPVANIEGATANQGMAICNGVVFQLYSNDRIELIDYDTGASLAILPITSDHGDTIDFGTEYYAEGDEFPLAYITADSNPAKVYVNRITRTECTLVRTYTFPLETTGYYAGHALDDVNKIIYMIGYKNASYYQNDGTNRLIVSKWNLLNAAISGQEYVPEFIESFELPFYTTLQGQTFFDGKIFAISSHFENPDTKVLVIDPGTQRISAIMDEFPAEVKNAEAEGLAFVEDGLKYKAVIKINNPYYYGIDF